MRIDKDDLLGNLYEMRAALSAISVERDKIDRLTGEFFRGKRDFVFTMIDQIITERCLNKRLRIENKNAWWKHKVQKGDLHEFYMELIFDSPYALQPDVLYFFSKNKNKYPGNYFDTEWQVDSYTMYAEMAKHITQLVFCRCPGMKYPYLDRLKAQLGYVRDPKKQRRRVLEVFMRWFGSEESIQHYYNKYAEIVSVIKAVNGQRKSGSQIQRDFRTLVYTNLQSAREVLARVINEMTRFDPQEISMLNEVRLIRQNVITLHDSLRTQNAQTLEPAQWENLDLFIYYVETHQADAPATAITLMKTKIAKDGSLEAEFKRATEQICKTMNVGLRVFQKNINSYLTRLQMVVSMVFEAQNEQLRRLAAPENLNAALAQKQQRGSRQLIEDVTYVRNYKI